MKDLVMGGLGTSEREAELALWLLVDFSSDIFKKDADVEPFLTIFMSN